MQVRQALTQVVFLVAAALSTSCAYGGFIANGDFSTSGSPPDPFATWTTFEDPFFGFDRPTDGGGFAVFSETGLFGSSQLEQAFLLPSGAQSISFEFRLASILGGSATSPVPDSFQATLYDDSFNPLLSAGDPFFFPAFYSVDNVGADPEFFDSTVVTSAGLADGWRRVTLDVSGLTPGPVTLEFILNGGNDGRETTVHLDNVAGLAPAVVVPEPGTIWIFGSGIAALLSWGACQRRSRSGPWSPPSTSAP